MEPVVTVGLDGSPESLAAAHWAADEAERRELTLRLLHAWPLLVEEPADVPAEKDQNYWARRIVDNTRVELQAHHPGLTVVGSLVADDAEHALLQAASESEMTVLGSRGLVPVESYFLGDISLPVVARAERPVVLVRAGAGDDGRQPAPSGTRGVVVALKLHGPCDNLLRFAFEAAAARGMPFGPSTAGACRWTRTCPGAWTMTWPRKSSRARRSSSAGPSFPGVRGSRRWTSPTARHW